NPFGGRTPSYRLVRAGPGEVSSFENAPAVTTQPTGFLAWLRRLVTPRPERLEGHFGMALGDLANPDTSPENQSEWRTVSPDEVEEFVAGKLFIVHSSNVESFQRRPDLGDMIVVYNAKDGRPKRIYRYWPISEKE